MPHNRYYGGICDNSNWYPDKTVKHSHVKSELSSHFMTKDQTKRKIWEDNIAKGPKHFKAEKRVNFPCFILTNVLSLKAAFASSINWKIYPIFISGY